MKITMTTGEDGLSVTLEADTTEEKLSPIDTIEMMEEVLKRLVELGLVIDGEMMEMLKMIGEAGKKDE